VQDATQLRSILVQLPPGLPAVRADFKLAKKALAQLLENATKYSPPDEPITITAESTGNFVVTIVADRGCGIDDSEQTLVSRNSIAGRATATWSKELEWDCLLRARLSRRTVVRCALQAGRDKAASFLSYCQSISKP
jgi:hypothetical protein